MKSLVIRFSSLDFFIHYPIFESNIYKSRRIHITPHKLNFEIESVQTNYKTYNYIGSRLPEKTEFSIIEKISVSLKLKCMMRPT